MKKKKRAFFRRNKLVIFLLMIVAIYYIYNMYSTDRKLKDYQDVQSSLKQEIEMLEKDISRLNDEYEYTQTTQAVEKIAREKLKMVKPNEIIYLIKGLDVKDSD